MTIITILPKKQEAIALEVIRVLYGRLKKFRRNPPEHGNLPFHEAFLNVLEPKFDKKTDAPYFILLDDLLNNLNTSPGRTFFEIVAHILSDGENREFVEGKNTSLRITTGQRDATNNIISNLKSGLQVPNTKAEDLHLLRAGTRGEEIIAPDFTVDNFAETASYIEAIELKSVSSYFEDIQDEKRKILNAKAGLRKKYPSKDIFFYFGFPFDPWSATPTGYNKDLFLRKLIEGKKYLDPNEVLLAGELWDKLSGQVNTMEQLLQIINSIASPEFMNQYEFLSDPANIDNNRAEYLQQLDFWGLFREKKIVENINVLRSKPRTRSLERSLNNKIFNRGEYNLNRYETLISFL